MEREKLLPAIGIKVSLTWRASGIYMTLTDVGEEYIYLGADPRRPITIVPLAEIAEVTWTETTKNEVTVKA